MKIRLEHGLAYLEVILTFRGRSLSIRDTNRWPELSNMAKRYSGYFGLERLANWLPAQRAGRI